MNNIRSFTSAILIVLVAVGISIAPQSQATTFTNRALFEAGLENLITDDYESGYISNGISKDLSDSDMSDVRGETIYATLDNINIVFITAFGEFSSSAYATAGPFALAFNETSIFTTSATTGVKGVYGVGFDFMNFNTDEFLYHAGVRYADNSFEVFALPFTSFPELLIREVGFFGVTSDKLINKIVIGNTPPDFGEQTSGRFTMDNLTIGNKRVSPIPLPAALPLFITGLAGLGLMRLRRRKASRD